MSVLDDYVIKTVLYLYFDAIKVTLVKNSAKEMHTEVF